MKSFPLSLKHWEIIIRKGRVEVFIWRTDKLLYYDEHHLIYREDNKTIKVKNKVVSLEWHRFLSDIVKTARPHTDGVLKKWINHAKFYNLFLFYGNEINAQAIKRYDKVR